MKLFITLCLLVTSFATSCSPSLPVTANQWESLGTRTVDYKVDRDEIIVTRKDGTFRKIQVKVESGRLNIHRCTVVFGDGTKQNVSLKKDFRAGQSSRIIDLEGGSRVIKKVVFVYDTKNWKAKKAKIRLLGMH